MDLQPPDGLIWFGISEFEVCNRIRHVIKGFMEIEDNLVVAFNKVAPVR